MRHGLSSLGRLESRVLITLQTVERRWRRCCPAQKPPLGWPPSSEQFFQRRGAIAVEHAQHCWAAPPTTVAAASW